MSVYCLCSFCAWFDIPIILTGLPSGDLVQSCYTTLILLDDHSITTTNELTHLKSKATAVGLTLETTWQCSDVQRSAAAIH